LRRYPNARALHPNAPFDNCVSLQELAGLTDIDRLALECKCRGTRNGSNTPDPRQSGVKFVSKTVAPVFLLRIRAEIRKRQHGDRKRLRLIR
jgi:hypothetical protein